jgi:hypothetical protein
MHIVRDGSSNLKFDGEKLAESTSRSHGRTRWVEFQLYRTAGGQYVLSRTGVSLYYHTASCSVVGRNKIKPVDVELLPAGLVACETCSPVPANEDSLYPETARYWAQVIDSGQGVVEALHKYDDTGSRYLTNVARNLLSRAALLDTDIADAYLNQYID